MDGVYTSEFRRVFLLTTNSTNINENMLSRPSRIRYMKEFGNLELAVVTEYLNDNLVDQTRKEDLIGYLDTLVFSTIDILKSIVDEVNIIGFDEFIQTRNDFNVKLAKYDYQTVRINCGRDLIADTKQLSQLVADFKAVLGIYTEYYSIPSDVYTEKIRPLQGKWKSYPEKRYVYNQNKLDTLKVGDCFGHYDSEHVVYIDLGQSIVITSDHDDGEMIIYFVLNPKAKASLYSQPKTLVF